MHIKLFTGNTQEKKSCWGFRHNWDDATAIVLSKIRCEDTNLIDLLDLGLFYRC
jgi:hypothetical protein